MTLVAGTDGARGRFLLRSPSGEEAASGVFALPPSAWVQRPLAGWLGDTAVPSGSTLELSVETGSLFPYEGVIDNGTGDPVLLAPQVVTPPSCAAGSAAILAASTSRVTAGASVALRLEGSGSPGRLVPGDLPLGPGGSVPAVPAVTTTYRWLPASAAARRAVVVTVNYRLSSLGWLAQPFLSGETRRGVSGNHGTLDQLAALRWTRRNVAAFSGDPSRVTVLGEPAGGVNVCTLVASPLARGLFVAGISESGGCGQRPIAEHVALGDTITTRAGCAAAADPAACLRALPFERILEALPPVVTVATSSGQLWGPAVDGFVLRDSPDAAMAKGEHNRVTFVTGANADGTAAAAPAITTEAEYRLAITTQYGVLAPVVLARYPASAYPTPRKAHVAVTTDARFVCPSRRHARTAAQGGSRVFRYLLSCPANRFYGATHGVELPFVLGSLGNIPGYTPDATALALSEAMNRAWARIAAAGDPNGSGVPAGPAHDPARDTTLVWDVPASAVDGIRTGACEFWDSLVPTL